MQLVGRQYLAESELLALDMEKMIREDFLRQDENEESEFCAFPKTVWMMRNFILFHDLALEVLSRRNDEVKGKPDENVEGEDSSVDQSQEMKKVALTWEMIKASMRDILYDLSNMKLMCHEEEGRKLNEEIKLAFLLEYDVEIRD